MRGEELTEVSGETQAWIAEAVLVMLLIVILPLLNGVGFLSDYYSESVRQIPGAGDPGPGHGPDLGLYRHFEPGTGGVFRPRRLCHGHASDVKSSGQGVYGEPIPDFMVWNRVPELPLFWKPFQYLPRGGALGACCCRRWSPPSSGC